MTPPVAVLRSTVTGGVSMAEYVSTKYLPLGLKVMTWFASSVVTCVRPVPS
jgi:hypothetical protein